MSDLPLSRGSTNSDDTADPPPPYSSPTRCRLVSRTSRPVQPAPLPLEALLTVGQLAELLGTSPTYVYRLVSERRIPFVKWGHYVRFQPSDIAAWLDANRIAPPPTKNGRGGNPSSADAMAGVRANSMRSLETSSSPVREPT